jgi:hypothetical protein
MLKLGRVFVVSAVALAGHGSGAAAQGLDWELERSFRYFRYASDEAVHRIAFDLLQAGQTPERMEKFINGEDFWSKPLPPPAQRPAHWPADWKEASTPRAIIAKMREQEGRSGLGAVEARGWASLLVQQKLPLSRTATCWNTVSRLHDNCKEYGDYVRPRYWNVRVFTTGTAPTGKCKWAIEGGTFENPKDKAPQRKPVIENASCTQVDAYVIAGNDPDTVTGSATVVRTSGDGATASTSVAVRDVLIVGMGDSITSGEGNPELGATFTRSPVNEPLYLPQRASTGWESAAQWTDRWCHRSVYSWQIRTMLQLALENRKRSVTALPYGCSGAEITEGILYTYKGVEFIQPNQQWAGHTAQMGVAYQELCKTYEPPAAFPAIPLREQDVSLATKNFMDPAQILKDVRRYVARCRTDGPSVFRRKADLMLLAIGINDVGFAKWVAGALTTDLAKSFAEGFVPRDPKDGKCTGDCVQTQRRLLRLASRYKVLRQVLDERFLKDAKLSPDNVLLLLYPSAIQNAAGTSCKTGNLGMTVATFNRSFSADDDDTRQCEGGIFGIGATTGYGALLAVREPEDVNAPSELEIIDRFLKDGLNRRAENFSALGGNPFVKLDGFHPQFLKRGFCASTDHLSQAESAQQPRCWAFEDLNTRLTNFECAATDRPCLARAAESLHVPRLFTHDNPQFIEKWRPFAADEFRPYQPRTRLFRTPNDVFILINKRSGNVLNDSPIGPVSLRDRASSGALHPTAEAHSIMATTASTIARGKISAGP